MENQNNYFASNLKFLRQKYQMEQIDLANRLGRKSSSSVSEWERGKYTPKAGVLNDISRIFNVSLSELMTKDLSDTSSPRTDNSAIAGSDEFAQVNGQIIDLRKAAANTMLFDGKPLNEDDIDFITSVLSAHFKSKGER